MAKIAQEWWRDPRCHFGVLKGDAPSLAQREHIQPAIEFICAELALPTGARILDLCCGPGRYVIELAHRGFAVVGIDLNEEYVALGRRVAEREGVSVELLTSDMREIPFVNHFDAIINIGTSFGFFDDEVDNRRVIEAVAEALKPGGIFVLEMGNRDYYLKNFVAKDWRKLEDGRVIIIQRDFDYVRGRINTTFEIPGSEGAKEEWSHSWRAYTLVEVVAMLKQAGLTLSHVLGDWKRSKYSVDCPRMVALSRKEKATSANSVLSAER